VRLLPIPKWASQYLREWLVERRRIIRLFVAAVALMLVATRMAHGADGQRVPVIGEVLFSTPSNAAPWDKAFRDGLRALGYIEGENINIVTRYAEGDASKLTAIFNELLTLQVDILLVADRAALAAKAATRIVPIISPTMGSPVELGLVESLGRPGGNLTGLSAQNRDSDPKRMELLAELVPGIRRLGLLFEGHPSQQGDLEAFRKLAGELGITTLRTFQAGNPEEIQTALRSISRERLQALIIWNSSTLGLHREEILRATSHRLPVLVNGREFAQSGALISYAPNTFDLYRRSAGYVDRILKGAKPADLPIEQPTKFELIINLKTAKELGIAIPQSILLRADETIR